MDRQDLIPDIVAALRRDYGFTEKTPAGGGKAALRDGLCPDCKKKSLWTWLDKPFHIQCNSVAKCGWESGIKNLYPDLFERFNERYPATPADPNATANAYLRYQRGFEPAELADWYSQANYWHPHGDSGTSTVRFPLAENVYWEKLIEPVTITDPKTGKTTKRTDTFGGLYGGLWWQPPGMTIEQNDTVYWAEGIFDAIALYLSGKKAVSIMSCGSFPEKSLTDHRGKNILWMLALDNDAAGRKYSKKHAESLRDMNERYDCVLPGESDLKTDWNDLWKQKRLDSDAWENYRYYGALLLADTREEKARLMYKYKGLTHFVFNFGQRTHAFSLNLEKYGKAVEVAQERLDDEEEIRDAAIAESSTVKEIATFNLAFRYVEKPETGEEGKYFFRVEYPNGSPAQNIALSGRVFGSSGDFKKNMQAIAPGSLWTGSSTHLDMLYRGWFYRRHKVITTIDYIGYDRDAGAYLYHDFAVKDGEIIPINSDDYFDLGKIGGMKSNSAIKLALSQDTNTDWVADFQIAFGLKGLTSLTYWFGSLFAEQIRDQHESYPFMEMCGEPGSGKSRLLEFLWKLCGRKNYEGFNPNISSMIGRSRELSQVGNLPVVMIEANHYEDKPHCKQVNWEEFLSLFDGNIGRITGQKTMGNETRYPPFRGTLVMSQNTPINASEAFLSRLIQNPFDRGHHSEAGRSASDRLNRLDVDTVSGFVKAAITQEAKIMERFNTLAKGYEDQLLATGKIKMGRIAKSHGQMMALAKCLPLVLPINDDTINALVKYIAGLAEARQAALSSDHPLIVRFWDAFHYLDRKAIKEGAEMVERKNQANHSNTPAREIAINLEHFQSDCAEHHLEPFSNRELRDLLSSSKRYPFIENRAVRSSITNTTLRCWVFQRPGAK